MSKEQYIKYEERKKKNYVQIVQEVGDVKPLR